MRLLAALYGLLRICLSLGWMLLLTPSFFVTALVKLLLPFPAAFRITSMLLVWHARTWAWSVWLLAKLPSGPQIAIDAPAQLKPNGRYLLVCNHRAWSDIVILLYFAQNRLPFPRFFLKRQLIWLPILGLIIWALDSPFMYRVTKSRLRNNPALRHRDRSITLAACHKYRQIPVTIVNFLESTRFTPGKHAAVAHPYQHLLRPRGEAAGMLLGELGPMLDGIIDVTLLYPPDVRPNLWNLACGRIGKVQLHARLLPVPASIAGHNLKQDVAARKAFRAWVNTTWAEKDARYSRMLSGQSTRYSHETIDKG